MEDPEDDRNILKKLLTWIASFELASFTLVLIFAGYIIVKYLVLQKKHEITYMTSFYSLTVALAISRVSFFIVFFSYSGEHFYQDYMSDVLLTIGPQFKLLIGLIQVAIMVELGIQVQLSARKLTPEEAVRKISKVRTALKLTVAFFSSMGVFMTNNLLHTDTTIVPEPKQWNIIIY